MYSKMAAVIIILLVLSCTGGHSHQKEQAGSRTKPLSDTNLTGIASIPLPAGFKRIFYKKETFGDWLRSLPLKKDKTVYLNNGSVKPNQAAQFAVLDVTVGDKDLQQCADAVMRLRAEYLFSRQRFTEISFTDNEAGIYKMAAPYTRDRFDVYLQRVFSMCGSASLSKQLRSVNMMAMQPGDVLIKGGFPGHAVIVVDMAENDQGEKIYMLAQSYMPAQDIHILLNPNSGENSPWYTLNNDKDIFTPEYYFTNEQLKTW